VKYKNCETIVKQEYMNTKWNSAPFRCGKLIAVAITITTIAFNSSPCRSQQGHAKQPTPPLQATNCKLVFEDEFNAPALIGDTWHEGVWWYHKHAPLSNISTADSALSLQWKRGQEADDTSIATLGRHDPNFAAWRYGYFEARMRWDVVNGAWPAFWLIPAQDANDQAIYKGTKETGEIDIFEGQGDHPHTFYGTIHDWVNLHDHANKNNEFILSKSTDFSQFHVYGLLWTPGKVTWYLDNQPLHSEVTPPIFDRQDFFLVLSMGEGQDWKAGNLSGVTATSMKMDVDWVRVWKN
jgi:beta-glucanase (GH16 family)